jgi:asparagine synthase (glutamine-hydrolysing)
VSDVPVGLLLSDGIDSQSILSALREGGHDPRAYTFRLLGGAAAVADVPGAAAESIALSREEYVAGIDRQCAHQTEPVGDVAALATGALIERSRAQATVFLCGHGGDEILGGYRLSQDRFRLEVLRRWGGVPAAWVQRGLDRHLFGDEPLPERVRAFLESPSRMAPARARYLMQRPVARAELTRLFGSPLPAPERYLGTLDRLYAECERDATDLGRMQEVMIRTFLSEDILPFADACAMAASAELRMPYLDRDLVDLVLTMPDQERVGVLPGSANTKLALRRWSHGRVAKGVRRRRKQGFATGKVEEILPRIGFVRDRVLGSAAIRRALPGAEAWFKEREPDWPKRADGVVWSLLTLAVWAEAVGAN